MAESVATSRSERRAAQRKARRRKLARRSLVALPLSILLAAGAMTAGALLRDDENGRVRRPVATRDSITTSTTAVPTTTAAARDPRRGSGQPVTFAFGGDTHFEGPLRSRLQGDPMGMLAPIAPVLSSADLAVVNLETAITERGAPRTRTSRSAPPPAQLPRWARRESTWRAWPTTTGSTTARTAWPTHCW